MTWEEWLFLEASKETGGQFQMHRLSPVKELYQDILALSPTQAFPCSSPTAGAATFRQVWRTWGWGSKVRNRLALQQEKKKFWWNMKSPCHTGCFACLYQHLSSGKWKILGERLKKTRLKYPTLKLQRCPSDTFSESLKLYPAVAWPHVLPALYFPLLLMWAQPERNLDLDSSAFLPLVPVLVTSWAMVKCVKEDQS